MTKLDFKPRGVCARMIHVELSEDGQTIENVSFEGGCNGNLKAIGKLVAGQPVDHIVERLEGNTCGPRYRVAERHVRPVEARCRVAGR